MERTLGRGLSTGAQSEIKEALINSMNRRHFIKTGLLAGLFCALPLTACRREDDTSAASDNLLPADKNGVRLPPGYTSRIVAHSSQSPVANSSFLWPGAPDGGACLATENGGWLYVVNSELNNTQGSVAVLKFASTGDVVDAYSIMNGGNRNCAGALTPWNTWLSCEEVKHGRVLECDPLGHQPAIERAMLGRFKHEAIAFDTQGRLYLTEDETDGRLYRFTPSLSGNLNSGLLEVAQVSGGEGAVQWHAVADPSASTIETRYQVGASTAFDGGEGICFRAGVIYFTTKGDDRVWAYTVDRQQVSIYYDRHTDPNPILSGVDNIIVTPSNELIVAEDGGDLQIVVIAQDQTLRPLLQLVGHDKSEITGLAFDPSGKRLYFNSQRGTTGSSAGGVSFEISGAFGNQRSTAITKSAQ